MSITFPPNLYENLEEVARQKKGVVGVSRARRNRKTTLLMQGSLKRIDAVVFKDKRDACGPPNQY